MINKPKSYGFGIDCKKMQKTKFGPYLTSLARRCSISFSTLMFNCSCLYSPNYTGEEWKTLQQWRS